MMFCVWISKLRIVIALSVTPIGKIPATTLNALPNPTARLMPPNMATRITSKIIVDSAICMYISEVEATIMMPPRQPIAAEMQYSRIVRRRTAMPESSAVCGLSPCA